MSRDEEAKNPRLFDSRIVERNIRKGLITRKDYEKHLKALPDAADKVAPPEAPRAAVIATAAPITIGAASADDDLDDQDTEEVTLDDEDIEPEDGDGGDKNNVPSS
jgi:hypothetical protein